MEGVRIPGLRQMEPELPVGKDWLIPIWSPDTDLTYKLPYAEIMAALGGMVFPTVANEFGDDQPAFETASDAVEWLLTNWFGGEGGLALNATKSATKFYRYRSRFEASQPGAYGGAVLDDLDYKTVCTYARIVVERWRDNPQNLSEQPRYQELVIVYSGSPDSPRGYRDGSFKGDLIGLQYIKIEDFRPPADVSNIPELDPNRADYPASYVVQRTYAGKPVLLRTRRAGGPYAAPLGPTGDNNWQPVAEAVAPAVFSQRVTLDEASGMDGENAQLGRTYAITGPWNGGPNDQIVTVRGVGNELRFDVTGTLEFNGVLSTIRNINTVAGTFDTGAGGGGSGAAITEFSQELGKFTLKTSDGATYTADLNEASAGKSFVSAGIVPDPFFTKGVNNNPGTSLWAHTDSWSVNVDGNPQVSGGGFLYTDIVGFTQYMQYVFLVDIVKITSGSIKLQLAGSLTINDSVELKEGVNLISVSMRDGTTCRFHVLGDANFSGIVGQMDIGNLMDGQTYASDFIRQSVANSTGLNSAKYLIGAKPLAKYNANTNMLVISDEATPFSTITNVSANGFYWYTPRAYKQMLFDSLGNLSVANDISGNSFTIQNKQVITYLNNLQSLLTIGVSNATFAAIGSDFSWINPNTQLGARLDENGNLRINGSLFGNVDISQFTDVPAQYNDLHKIALAVANGTMQPLRTYAQLMAIRDSGGLTRGTQYLLAYMPMHTIPGTNVLKTFPLEVLLLTANSTATFAEIGLSLTFGDTVYYRANPGPRRPGAAQGYVWRRIDHAENNDFEFDSRHTYFRRWQKALPQNDYQGNNNLYISSTDTGLPFQDVPVFYNYPAQVNGNRWGNFDQVAPNTASIFSVFNFVQLLGCPIFSNVISNTRLSGVTISSGAWFHNSNLIDSELNNVSVVRTAFFTFLRARFIGSTLSNRVVIDDATKVVAINSVLSQEPMAYRTFINGAEYNAGLTASQKNEVLALTYTDCDAPVGSSPVWSHKGYAFDSIYNGKKARFYFDYETYNPATPAAVLGMCWHYTLKLG